MEQAVLVYRHHLGGTQIHMEGLEQQQQQQLMVNLLDNAEIPQTLNMRDPHLLVRKKFSCS